MNKLARVKFKLEFRIVKANKIKGKISRDSNLEHKELSCSRKKYKQVWSLLNRVVLVIRKMKTRHLRGIRTYKRSIERMPMKTDQSKTKLDQHSIRSYTHHHM
uniref:Uncharacterized protein n=1 Tax=Cacopsylla melanoneura TaxID=428564 RepID=A0A8D8MF02_9HEMI